jgi:prevent-host-death family protein
MKPVNIHEAKTHFSRLIDQVGSGETVVIAKSGVPVAKLTRIDAAPTPTRTGFLIGRITVPDDFDRMGDHEIEAQFDGLS